MAFRISGKTIPASPTGQWQLYAVTRAEQNADANPASLALNGGVYDNAATNYPVERKLSLQELGAAYRSQLLGTFAPGTERDIFISPMNNPHVKAVWIDRVFLVPAPR